MHEYVDHLLIKQVCFQCIVDISQQISYPSVEAVTMATFPLRLLCDIFLCPATRLDLMHLNVDLNITCVCRKRQVCYQMISCKTTSNKKQESFVLKMFSHS